MLKVLNLVRCGTRNMFPVTDDILPQGGRPTFISIVRYKAYIFGSGCLQRTAKVYRGLRPCNVHRLPRQQINCAIDLYGLIPGSNCLFSDQWSVVQQFFTWGRCGMEYVQFPCVSYEATKMVYRRQRVYKRRTTLASCVTSTGMSAQNASNILEPVMPNPYKTSFTHDATCCWMGCTILQKSAFPPPPLKFLHTHSSLRPSHSLPYVYKS